MNSHCVLSSWRSLLLGGQAPLPALGAQASLPALPESSALVFTSTTLFAQTNDSAATVRGRVIDASGVAMTGALGFYSITNRRRDGRWRI
jgi:hypothetical protein